MDQNGAHNLFRNIKPPATGHISSVAVVGEGGEGGSNDDEDIPDPERPLRGFPRSFPNE